MQITITRNFSEWAQQDIFLQKLEFKRELAKGNYTRDHIRQIRSYGIPINFLALTHALMRDYCEVGFACFSQIRFICWFWDNGDKIIFPLNSNNQLYLGNDSDFWCQFWPFLKQINLNTYECQLIESDEDIIWADKDDYALALGGQSHFGHFVTNRVAALNQSNLAYPYISSLKTILVPTNYLKLHECILASILGGSPKMFKEFPSEAKIYKFKNIVVPCIDEHYNAITGLQGVLEQNYTNRSIEKNKKVYITRAFKNNNDRLIDYRKFILMLQDLGFIIVNPINLSFKDRLDLIGNSQFILTDSGSCSLNGVLFGNSHSLLKQMMPRRVINSTDESVINQLCMGFNQGIKGQWLILEAEIESIVNPWYDICNPPCKSMLQKLIY